ncbi:MAG: DEAD/DEAH box helicase, partial [Prevotella sp.]|nr:DEAD/DEAH box helicase [Prevotella sp.]
DSYLKRLASTLARLYNKANASQREEFEKMAHIKMDVIARQIYVSLESGKLPPYNDIDEPNTERKRLVAPITNHAEVREYILTLAAGFVTTLIPGEDELISQGFSKEEARDTTKAFEEYCRSHADKIEALRILYNNELKPINYEMLRDLEEKLIKENNNFTQRLLWNYYAVLNPEKVKRAESKKETEAITNIIQLVRFAYSQTEMLESAYPTARKYFNLWYGRKQMNITDHQREVISQVVEYIACNGACTVRDLRQTKPTEAARLTRSFGNMQKADAALFSLYNFIVLKKNA